MKRLLTHEEELKSGRKIKLCLKRLARLLPRHPLGYRRFLARMGEVTGGGGLMFSWLSLRERMTEDLNAGRRALERTEGYLRKKAKSQEKSLKILSWKNAFRMDGKPANIFATLAHHPKLLKRWLVFGNHVLAKQTLSPRDRELAILRIGWLCRAEYEWAQHVVIGRRSGIEEEEILRVVDGPDAPGWTAADALLLRAVDELHADSMISDPTWKGLAEQHSTQQLLDLVFTVGQYNLVCMALNTLGVQLDPGLEGFPR